MWLSEELLQRNQLQATSDAGEAPCELVGEEVQRLSVVLNLPALLEAGQSACMTRIVPKVQLALPSASTEFHMAASSTFKTILERQLVHPRTFTQTFLQSILSSIDSRDPVVANAWLETLLDVIGLLPVESIKVDILPLAVQKGQLNQKLANRITACKLLGKIALRFDQGAIKKDVLSLVLSLCQDVRAEVRACACLQLSHVSQGLGWEDVKPSLLPSLVELAGDAEMQVRLAACQAVVDIIPFLNKESHQSTIVPLCRKLLDTSMKAQNEVMLSLTRLYGRMCLGLEAAMTSEEKRAFVTTYCELAQIGVKFRPRRDQMPDVVPVVQENARMYGECRHNCAFNFPAMVVFANMRGDTWKLLYPVLGELAGDAFPLVRKTISTGIHEVAKILGNSAGMLRPELLRLLRDDEEEVLRGLIPHLSATLQLMVKCRTFGPDVQDSTSDLGKSLLKCEALVAKTNDWRLHEAFLTQWECLPQCLPSDFIYAYFVNIVFERIHHARQIPVRLAACKTLLFLLRYNLKIPQRHDMMSRLFIELAQGRSCFSRMAYIKTARFSLDVFSNKFFKEHFCQPLLELTEDRVANNRLMVVSMLPQVKATLTLPSDKKLLTMLESCVRRLLGTEKDCDVVSCLRTAVNKMDGIDVAQDPARRVKSSDMEDARRAEEESKIASKCTTKGDTKPAARSSLPADPGRNISPGPVHAASQMLGSAQAREGDTRRRAQESLLHPTSTPRSSSSASPSSSMPAFKSAPAQPQPRQPQPPAPPKKPVAPGLANSSPNVSLEEEFFVDAGIKLPTNYASNSLPSRIPNLREMLFKARYLDDKKCDRESTSLSDIGISKARAKVNTASLKTLLMSPGTIANRRHSYLEKPLKAQSKLVVDNSNRRHSYIEKLQITVRDDGDKSAVKLTRQNSDNPIFHSKREVDFPARNRLGHRNKEEVESLSSQLKAYQLKRVEDWPRHEQSPHETLVREKRDPGVNKHSLNFASTSDRLRTNCHSTLEVDSLILESRLQRPGFVLVNSLTPSRTVTNSSPTQRNRSASPTQWNVRTSAARLRSPDTASRLPVRKKV